MTNTAKEYYSLVEIKMRWPCVIAEPAGIEIDDLGNQWIDDPQCGGRTPPPWRIGQTSTEVEAVPVLESIDPVVNSLATDVQQFGDLLHRFALIKPEYGLGTATLLRPRSVKHEVL